MAIFGEQSDVTITLAKRKEIAAKRIRERVDNFQERIRRRHLVIFNDIWDNQDNLTPQQVLDALGTDAGTVVQLSRDLITMMVGADPDFEIPQTPNGETITINGDNTATVNDPE